LYVWETSIELFMEIYAILLNFTSLTTICLPFINNKQSSSKTDRHTGQTHQTQFYRSVSFSSPNKYMYLSVSFSSIKIAPFSHGITITSLPTQKNSLSMSLCVLDHRQSPQSQLYGYYLKVGMQAVDVEIWGLVRI
jgi:hypothetical protein